MHETLVADFKPFKAASQASLPKAFEFASKNTVDVANEKSYRP